jgi:hypothetical protein
MHVKQTFRHWPDVGHDRRAEGDVGHEMPVHHIDMHPFGPALVDGAHFVA